MQTDMRVAILVAILVIVNRKKSIFKLVREFDKIHMKFGRNRVINKLECPQVQTDRRWPFWQPSLSSDKTHSNLGEGLIKVIHMKFGSNWST